MSSSQKTVLLQGKIPQLPRYFLQGLQMNSQRHRCWPWARDFFSSLLALIQILCPSLWLCGLFAKELLCIGVSPFREHVCAQLWKTAHCLTKGSESLDTFCLSPLLYAWWKRKDAEYFPSHRSMIFHFKCTVPLAGLQEHSGVKEAHLGMRWSSVQLIWFIWNAS